MQTLTFEVGDEAVVELKSIRGDLRLSGRQGGQVEIKAYSDDVKVGQERNTLTIDCPSDCLIFLPSGSRIEGRSIGGDVRATNVRGEVALRTVGGDLSLRGSGKCVVETIGGNFHSRKATGDIHVDRIGGDAVIDRISGDVVLRSVGGDLKLRRVDGVVEATAGGDVSLMFTTLGGENVSVGAGGDLSCALPREASASVTVSAGGEVFIPGGVETQEKDNGQRFKFGGGKTKIGLTAGGDLYLHGEETSESPAFEDLGETIASQVESEVEAGIAEMEARLEALGSGLGSFPSDRIGDQVRRAFARARRKAQRGRKRAERAKERAEKKRRSVDLHFGGGQTSSQQVSEEERLTILRMLEKGTITVEEAEKLLQTLEGDL